jgi:SAM-dependent methyltransferase
VSVGDLAGLLARWDAQQARYLPGREERFRLICDLVEQIAPPSPRILDLCAGPGSLSARMLERLPESAVTAVDFDPAHIELGRRRLGDRVTWCELDLLRPGWDEQFADGSFDAVVTATAIHWFTAEEIVPLYRSLARLLPRGGLFANADHLPISAPRIAAISADLLDRWQDEQLAGAEDYTEYRAALRSEPALAEDVEAGDRLLGNRHPGSTLPIAFHQAALAVAGFAEAGEVWRHHTDALLVALR